MPLILDNIIVLLWRTIGHLFRESRCRKWPILDGILDNIDCPEHESYPYAEIHYCYTVRGVEYDQRCLRGYWLTESAEDLARFYRNLDSIRVRYCPEDPSKAYILDDDQQLRDQTSKKL
jgi:hypothetical protein